MNLLHLTNRYIFHYYDFFYIKKYIDIVEEKYNAANSEMSDYITADNSKIDIITKEVAGNKMVKDIKYIPNENVR